MAIGIIGPYYSHGLDVTTAAASLLLPPPLLPLLSLVLLFVSICGSIHPSLALILASYFGTICSDKNTVTTGTGDGGNLRDREIPPYNPSAVPHVACR